MLCVRVGHVWTYMDRVYFVLLMMWAHSKWIQFKWGEWRNNNNGTKIDNGKHKTEETKKIEKKNRRQPAMLYNNVDDDRSVVSFTAHICQISHVLTAHTTSYTYFGSQLEHSLACVCVCARLCHCNPIQNWLFNFTSYSVKLQHNFARKFPQTTSNCNLL